MAPPRWEHLGSEGEDTHLSEGRTSSQRGGQTQRSQGGGMLSTLEHLASQAWAGLEAKIRAEERDVI